MTPEQYLEEWARKNLEQLTKAGYTPALVEGRVEWRRNGSLVTLTELSEVLGRPRYTTVGLLLDAAKAAGVTA